jgi:hypothetical protein
MLKIDPKICVSLEGLSAALRLPPDVTGVMLLSKNGGGRRGRYGRRVMQLGRTLVELCGFMHDLSPSWS